MSGSRLNREKRIVISPLQLPLPLPNSWLSSLSLLPRDPGTSICSLCRGSHRSSCRRSRSSRRSSHRSSCRSSCRSSRRSSSSGRSSGSNGRSSRAHGAIVKPPYTCRATIICCSSLRHTTAPNKNTARITVYSAVYCMSQLQKIHLWR